MRAIAEVLAFLLGFLSVIMVGVSLQNPYWRVSSDDGNVIRTSTIYENLWMSCASDSSGTFNCRDFPSLFALSGKWVILGLPYRTVTPVSTVDGNVITTANIHGNLSISYATDSTTVNKYRGFKFFLALSGPLQAFRALMIAAIAMGTAGVFATLVGMKCSKVMGENYVLKGRTAGTGGTFFLLQGLCTMISVSWYAFNITQEFFDPLYPGIKYELGEALYIGWVSATIAICGGVCLLCSCKSANSEKLPYHYESARGTVYSARQGIEDPGLPNTPSHYGRNAYV